MSKHEEAMRIMEALSGVDEKLLARSEAPGRRRDRAEEDLGGSGAGRADKKSRRKIYGWRYFGRCAAVLALAVAGVVSWRGFLVTKDAAKNESASGGSPEMFVNAYDLSLDPGNGEGGDGSLENGGPQNMVSGGAVTESALTGKDGQNGPGKTPAAFPAASAGQTDADVSDKLGGFDGSDIRDSSDGLKSEECFVQEVRMLTAEEAGQLEPLGDYLPTDLPAGYVFGSARYEADSGVLTVCWNRGADGIMLSFEQKEGGPAETVDIQRPETYDGRLYEIPYGDTVPEEYRETFFAPVFAKDDFSLEIVRSRVLSYNGDGGDTSVPRGDFSVLYDDVLVHFNGRGTPEEIWEMFASIAE